MPSATTQMQSISGIITQTHLTSGEIPPPLVGASVTVVDDRVFVFAGRLVTSRKMTNYMYVLDLNTLEWTRHIPPPDSAKPPKPRYFHSADVYKNSIVVFGGMGYSRMSGDGLCVLDDVSVFDIETMSWRRPNVEPSLFAPRPRYAHLSAVTDDRLIIIGGQDMNNGYLEEINILDMRKWEWVHAKSFNKHVGAYRSIAITAPSGTRLPVMLKEQMGRPLDSMVNDDANLKKTNDGTPAAGGNGRVSLVDQSSGDRSEVETSPVYLYTNSNFAEVKRELQLLFSPSGASSSVEDCSSYMTGSAMPPGLRFPTGHTLGHHLILAGTYLSPQSHSFSVWTLDLGTLTWSRIETGAVFSTGSWNRGVLHERTNRFLVFGHRARNLLEDYNHRQVNFNHVAMIDMEAFGVYRLPKPTCSTLAQEMGLSLLNEPAVCDFRIITNENQAIPVNSAVLCQRWPYFARLMEGNRDVVHPAGSAEDEPAATERQRMTSALKSHSMTFPYPYAVVIALLQFLYTDNLLTAQQYQPHILSQLLLLADMYELPRLQELATHALHQMLNMSTAPLIFETAALSHQTSLQVRALKMMIAAKRMIQQQQQQRQEQPTPVLTPREGPSSEPLYRRPREYSQSPSPSSSSVASSSYYRSPSTSSSLPQQQRRQTMDQQQPIDTPRSANFDYQYTSSPKLSTFRSRAPSFTQSPPPGNQFMKSPPVRQSPSSYSSSSSGYGNNENYRYPSSSSSPPQTPRHGMPPTIPEMSSPGSVSGWSHYSESTSKGRNENTGKSKKKDKKAALLGSVGNKLSMSFQ